MRPKSKVKFVEHLLKIRPLVVIAWSFTPRFISEFALKIFRNSEGSWAFGLRYLCLNRLAKQCGEKVIIFPNVFLRNINRLSVGTNVSIHEMAYIDSFGEITIGNNVAISHGVSIVSFDHDIAHDPTNFKDCPPICGKIIVGDNVWIGAGARILKGVSVGEDSILAAGCVIRKSCNPLSIMGGIPAELVKRISGELCQETDKKE